MVSFRKSMYPGSAAGVARTKASQKYWPTAYDGSDSGHHDPVLTHGCLRKLKICVHSHIFETQSQRNKALEFPVSRRRMYNDFAKKQKGIEA